jgi:hypothetical protein
MQSIKCRHCRGRGTIPITGVYADTLTRLRRCDSPVSGADLAAQMGVSNEAMCNRLRALERHGLTVGRQYGRKVMWRAV